MPTFSIVIPTYNHGYLIGRCLQSVINQTFTNWEVIIVNNYSIDNTIDIVNTFSDTRINLINFNNNGVIGASRNVGIRSSKADWIAFLDSDDWWYPNKLSICSKHLNNGDILYHDLHIINQNGIKYRKAKGRKLRIPAFNDLMTNGNPLATSSVIIKKDILNSVNLFDENKMLIGVEDFDLWLRISREKGKFYYIEKTLGAYWVGGGNVTQASEERYKRLIYVYNRFLPFLSPQDRRQSEAAMSYTLGSIRWRMGLIYEAIKLFNVSKGYDKLEIKIKSYFIIAYHYISKKFIKLEKWGSLFWKN